MKLLNLKLRGAIGVKKGLALDEIEIDFTKFAPGLIALTGKNGSSKSTILENCHPYRCMVSRTGSLQSHFFLKDSYRILKFELDNKIYESKTFIDALTGGSESYLYCNDVALNDGKLTTFDEELEKVLGSQELFFNSVFSGQRSKGIAELKPADRRKLFYELLNLNIYEQYLETSKSKLKSNEIKLAEIEGQINSFSVGEDEKTQLEQNRITALNNIANTEIEITKIEAELDKINLSIRDAEIEIAKLEEKQKANEEINQKIVELKSKSDSLFAEMNRKENKFTSDIDDTTKLISHSQKLLLNKEEIESRLKSISGLESEVNAINTEKNGTISKQNELNKNYAVITEDLNVKDKALIELDREYDKQAIEKENLDKKIDSIESEIKIIDDVPCDSEIGSNCQFLKNAYSSKESLQSLVEKRADLVNTLLNKQQFIAKKVKEFAAEKTAAEKKYELENNQYKTKLNVCGLNLLTLETKLKKLNETDWKSQKAELLEAETNIKLLTQKLENLIQQKEDSFKNYKEQINQLSEDSKSLSAKLDPKILNKIVDAKNVLDLNQSKKDEVKQDLQIAHDDLNYQKAVLSDCEAQLEQIKKNEEKIIKLQESKISVQNEIKDWTFLTKAFDKTGIPVLKLENSGIEITTIANELLSLFENKFRIVFETTQLKADKKSYKESFNINIIQDDGVTELSNLSGGERTWVETAIQLAISLFIRQQGKNIRTSFLDENDGQLDADAANNYLVMLQKAHNSSNIHNTFFISHRTELLDLIPQKIYLHDGLLDIINNN